MPYLFIILFKVNVVLLLFAGAYYVVLRKLTFYVLNRLFLVFGILFSSAYPLMDLTDFYYRQNLPQLVPRINQDLAKLGQHTSYAAYWEALTIVLYVGIFIMGLRLATQFLSLYRIHRNSLPSKIEGYRVRILKDEVAPFSFWQTIYINPSIHKRQDINNILRHEKVHIKEWHTLDIILAELNLIFYWFNPGAWLMKKAVRENIEYITDQIMLKKGTDKKTYQYSLLNVGVLGTPAQIVNSFTLADLKRRIKMMNTPRSSLLNLSRYLLVLPAVLLLSLAFTIAKKDTFPERSEARVQQAGEPVPPAIKQGIQRERKITFRRKFFVDTAANASETRQQRLLLPGDSVRRPGDLFPEHLPGNKKIRVLALKGVGNITDGPLGFNDTAKRRVKKLFIRMKEPGDNPESPDVLETIKEEVNSFYIAGKLEKLFFNGQQVTRKELEKKLSPHQLTRVIVRKEGIYITTGEKF